MSWPTDNPEARRVLERVRTAEPLECRECGVICERVVFPWRCLWERRTCVYAFHDGESMYFGCLHKVFGPEIEVVGGEVSGLAGGRQGDPYGPLRIMRAPRPQCPVTVERAYPRERSGSGCVNALFLHEAFRVRWCGDASTWDEDGLTTDKPSVG